MVSKRTMVEQAEKAKAELVKIQAQKDLLKKLHTNSETKQS